MAPTLLLSRSSTPGSNADTMSLTNPIYIAGFVLAGVLSLGVATWLALRLYRQRVAERRESKMGAAFLSVKGLRPEGQSLREKPASRAIDTPTNPRNQLPNPTIILPDNDKVLSRDEVIEHHRQSGNYPSSFIQKPFSFALATTSSGSPTLDIKPFSNGSRHSRMSSFNSIAPSSRRFSVLSTASSAGSALTSVATGGTTRKVRQLYDPVLPDELSIVLGETLTIVQSFDDGWCVVGREGSPFVQHAKSLFSSTAPSVSAGILKGKENIELGAVPAWCFLKPVKGLLAQRPVRSSSLGITVQMEAPAFSSRQELVSWSNF